MDKTQLIDPNKQQITKRKQSKKLGVENSMLIKTLLKEHRVSHDRKGRRENKKLRDSLNTNPNHKPNWI